MTDDTTVSTPTAGPTPHPQCPVRAGDALVLVARPDLGCTVLDLFDDDGIVSCAIRTVTGTRGLLGPWELQPDGGGDPHWQQRMHTFRESQCARAYDLLDTRRHLAADRAETLAAHYTALTGLLRAGRLPAPGSEPAELAAGDFDEALNRLRDLRDELAHLGLLPARPPYSNTPPPTPSVTRTPPNNP